VEQRPKEQSPEHFPRAFFLPRLPREYYKGDAVIHWTLTLNGRATVWLSQDVHSKFRELLLHTAAREGLFCPTYCLRPDHMHLIWMGLRRDCDQRNGMAFLRTYLGPAIAPAEFQNQAHERVLRDPDRRENAFAKTCLYVVENPVRACLAEKAEQWRFHGAIVPGYPTLHPLQPDFWQKFWRLYRRARHPDAGTIKHPLFNFVEVDVRRP
jgi:REP element-mobilizing transposase RayT